jgi:hypothetical protein
MRLILIILLLLCFGKCATTSQKELFTKVSKWNWSSNQGYMNWNDANAKCYGIGMRLPTTDELNAVFESYLGERWLQEDYELRTGYFYWTSTSMTLFGLSNSHAAAVAMKNSIWPGHADARSMEKERKNNVRCIQIN